jgi:CDP-diacylglycerol--serine O-phosphatidyltransferase
MSENEEPRGGIYIYVLPNLVTTANIFFGFFAVIQSIRGRFDIAAYAIVAAAIFDMLDGRLARMTRATSKFGAEYDSLCDLISFGMAPAVLLYMWALQPFGRLGWLASFIYLAGGALRLARFNVQSNRIDPGFFQGLPIPMAAGIVASSVLAFREMDWEPMGSLGLLLMTFLLGLVMVSNFRYRSFKDIDFRKRMPFRHLVLGILIFAWVAYDPELNLFILFLSYAVLGALFGIFKIGLKARSFSRAKVRPASDSVIEDSKK